MKRRTQNIFDGLSLTGKVVLGDKRLAKGLIAGACYTAAAAVQKYKSVSPSEGWKVPESNIRQGSAAYHLKK